MEQTRAERKFKKRRLEEVIPELPNDMHVPERTHISKTSKRRKCNRSPANEARQSPVSTNTGQIQLTSGNLAGGRGARAPNNGTWASDGSEMQDPRILKLADDEFEAHSARQLGLATINNKPPPQKSKKERKAERKAENTKTAASAPPVSSRVADTNVIPNETPPIQNQNKINNIAEATGPKKQNSKKVAKAGPRFIVFVGNLPYSATTESIHKHLAAVHPQSVRHLTSKGKPSKSRGYAFVEFGGFDHMKACLKTFHHSMFSDGISEARKINIELTAGGGGNKANRQAKIGSKNQKLSEERIRRMQNEVQTKMIKKSLPNHSDIHPSRRKLVPESC